MTCGLGLGHILAIPYFIGLPVYQYNILGKNLENGCNRFTRKCKGSTCKIWSV